MILWHSQIELHGDKATPHNHNCTMMCLLLLFLTYECTNFLLRKALFSNNQPQVRTSVFHCNVHPFGLFLRGNEFSGKFTILILSQIQVEIFFRWCRYWESGTRRRKVKEGMQKRTDYGSLHTAQLQASWEEDSLYPDAIVTRPFCGWCR